MERAEHTIRNVQFEDGLHNLKGKLDCMGRLNDVADSLYSKLIDECDSLTSQVASGETVQRLANAFKDVVASIDDLNCHAAHAQTTV